MSLEQTHTLNAEDVIPESNEVDGCLLKDTRLEARQEARRQRNREFAKRSNHVRKVKNEGLKSSIQEGRQCVVQLLEREAELRKENSRLRQKGSKPGGC